PDFADALTGVVKGLRIGVLRQSFMDATAAASRDVVERAIKGLEDLGAAVQEARLDTVKLAAAAATAVVAAEAYAYHEPWIKTRPKEYGADVRERLRTSAFVSAADYLNGQRVRVLIRDDVDAALSRLDVLVAPTTAIAATPV